MKAVRVSAGERLRFGWKFPPCNSSFFYFVLTNKLSSTIYFSVSGLSLHEQPNPGMSSFFKRPSWATKQTEETSTEFYRRSEQTYSDIVAATREAHQKPKKSKKTDEPKKRRRISAEEADSNSGRDESHEKSPKPELSSSRHPSSSPRPISRTIKSHSPEIASYAPCEKPKSPEAQVPQAVQPAKPPIDLKISSPRPAQSISPPIDDPIVQIMITSEIENTKPLLVQRKLSQGLREVRLAWCNRQNFTPEIQSAIYLTWKGRRLFDVTTCRSLGIHTGSSSMAAFSIDNDPFADQQELQIHMEAVADRPILTNRQSVSNNNRLPNPISNPSEDDQGEPLKLILRCPGFENFKIKARRTTLISRLISAFRDKQNISVDQSIILMFDGDKLDPNSYLRDHDIDDLDLVDVQIK
jgi:hypothetical protein